MAKQLYYGGNIITMEGEDAEAVLVQDGRILRTGTFEEMKCSAGPNTQFIDLIGNTLLPGLIDSHSHITAFAQTLSLVQLNDVKSFDEIVERISVFRSENHLNNTDWISGFGYDHNFLKEKMHPDKTVLNQFPNPIVIAHASGHMGIMNQAALDAVGINAGTPDPQGGKIGRFSGSTEPNGYLEETAFTQASAKMPKPAIADMEKQLRKAQDIYFRYGITTAQDGLTRKNEWNLLKSASEHNHLKMDIVSYIDLEQCHDLAKQNQLYLKNYQNRLKIGGYKIFLDGSPQGRTAWMSTPYEGDTYCGYPVHTDQEVINFMKTAVDENIQILVHCNGDAAAEQMIDSYQKVYEPQKNIRPVMIHAQLVREDQLKRMAALSMTASFFTAHTWYWGDIHLKNFGKQRAEQISPAKDAILHGVNYTFHQDTPVIQPDMLETLWCAVNRISKNGVLMGREQRVTVYEALRGITINAAYQYFEERQKGSIKPGKLADFVVLDKNPLETAPEELKNIQIVQTIKEGEVVYER